jgi:hypothetical protein
MFYSRENEFHDPAGADAYRSWLISRNQPPIVYHSGEMHWKRLRVAARQSVNHIKGFIAAIRVALAADKMRRVHRELAFHNVRLERTKSPTTDDRSGR